MTYGNYTKIFVKPVGRVRNNPPVMSIIPETGEWVKPTAYIQRLIAQECLTPEKARSVVDGKVVEVKLPVLVPEKTDDKAEGDDKGEDVKTPPVKTPPVSTPASPPAATNKKP